ncbi:MAG TPA: penicillin-binding protein 2 [Bacillota bacterium]|nr:penicillin-binding protein 2 [Bacillota bacterium]
MKKKTKRSQLPLRLNILFFIVFLLFSILILQLGVVQILNGENFQEEIDRTVEDTTETPAPRGIIYDRNLNVIADNKPMYAITYTPAKGTQAEDRLEVAQKLSKYISMFSNDEAEKERQLKSITDRDKKEYWYLLNEDEAKGRLTEEEKAELEPDEQYEKILERITDEEIAHFSEEELEVILIKKELDKAPYLTPQIVKNKGVTAEEYARVAEHLDELPGINATTDWDRKYPYKDAFRSFLGNITDQEEGILAEKEDYYMTRGYSRNDRVGRSGLEAQYEDLLRGRKEKTKYTTDKSGKVIDSEVVVQGERGKDLVLTIDMELQQRVDKIVQEELEAAIKEHPNANRYLEDALAVVIDPQTGELLAVSGYHYDRENKKFENAAYKTLYDAHLPGSAIKGATVLAGYQSGVIEPGQKFLDKPIKIANDNPKGSWKNLGPVNDLDAIARSSNIYMFRIAMRIGGVHDEKFYYDSLRYKGNPFQEMRNYFRQFGLGTETGIDFPYEATGYTGNDTSTPGLLLDYAIGQYDSYTTMQLAQYVSTIANGGYRVRPHFLKSVHMASPYEDELGSLYRSHNKDVLNRVQMNEKYIERVQEGFRRAFQESGGTASQYFSNKDYKPAGKTGTAENVLFDDSKEINTENLSLVGYAPFDEPEVAFATIIPQLGNIQDQYPINNKIGERILDAYFELKEKRDKKAADENKNDEENKEESGD